MQSTDIKLFDEDVDQSYADEFKTSLQKLDHLINILSSVYGMCKKNQIILNQNEGTQVETTVAKRDSTDILTFNVNINDDNFVHCHAKKGKYSIKIIDTITGKSRLNPFGLHRCPPTLEIDKDSKTKEFSSFPKSSSLHSRTIPSELSAPNSFQSRRSFHTLPHKFGNFSSTLVQQILTIKTEIQGLRRVFNNAECNLDNSDNSRVYFKIGDLSTWLLQTKTNVEKSILNTEDVKLIHGKIRATNFCKFYKLVKMKKHKRGKNIRRKKAITE